MLAINGWDAYSAQSLRARLITKHHIQSASIFFFSLPCVPFHEATTQHSYCSTSYLILTCSWVGKWSCEVDFVHVITCPKWVLPSFWSPCVALRLLHFRACFRMSAFRVSAPVFVLLFFSPAFSCDTECITGADTPTHKFLAQWAWMPPLVRHIGLRLHFWTAWSGSGKSPENRPMDRRGGKIERGTFGSAIVVRFLFVLNCHFYHQKLGPTQCLMRSWTGDNGVRHCLCVLKANGVVRFCKVSA